MSEGENGRDYLGGQTAWREAGEGDPVIFLHGLGGTRTAWGPQMRSRSSRFRCIAWDMPGYGGSELLVPLTYKGIADRLVEFLDALEIARADLVGLSFGGMHALHTALHYPERVGRMVLADSSPAFGIDGTAAEDWKRSRLQVVDNGGQPGDAAEAIIDAITAKPLTGAIRIETIAAFREIGTPGFRAAVACLPDNDVRDQLATIGHKTLVVVGELDEETPVSYSRILADGLQHGELHIIEGVGHLTPAEAPDVFNDLVAEFLLANRTHTRV